ncbi:hypothetical protein PENTCL1PPCAC_7204, partial [Pristionchus entomophagus]
AYNSEIDRFVELLKRIREKKNEKKVYDAVMLTYTNLKGTKCSQCSVTIDCYNNFISHMVSAQHVKLMRNNGVSRNSIIFLSEEFKKFA